jgi:hypothetical protein
MVAVHCFDGDSGGDSGGGAVMRVVMVVQHGGGEQWQRMVGERDNGGW